MNIRNLPHYNKHLATVAGLVGFAAAWLGVRAELLTPEALNDIAAGIMVLVSIAVRQVANRPKADE